MTLAKAIATRKPIWRKAWGLVTPSENGLFVAGNMWVDAKTYKVYLQVADIEWKLKDFIVLKNVN